MAKKPQPRISNATAKTSIAKSEPKADATDTQADSQAIQNSPKSLEPKAAESPSAKLEARHAQTKADITT